MTDVQEQIKKLRICCPDPPSAKGCTHWNADRVVDLCQNAADTIESQQARIEKLEKAYAIAYGATYQGHSAHWDSQGTHGANCPACIEARDARKQCLALAALQTDMDEKGQDHGNG